MPDLILALRCAVSIAVFVTQDALHRHPTCPQVDLLPPWRRAELLAAEKVA